MTLEGYLLVRVVGGRQYDKAWVHRFICEEERYGGTWQKSGSIASHNGDHPSLKKG